MTLRSRPVTKGAPYRSGAAALLGSILVILTALGFEYIGRYMPCPLCLMQRYSYYAAIPLLFFALVLVAAERPGAAALLFLVVGLAFVVNAGLGVYHAGAEWKFWPGPDTCAVVSDSLTTPSGGLLKELEHTRVTRCDEAPWRMLGLSFAGWNVVASSLLAILCLQAAAASHASRR
jgi:disulfide bond formation protein DsbB